MKLNQYTTLVEAEQKLRRKGYVHTFKSERSDLLRCIETGKHYTPDQMLIFEYYRFEGLSNPSDMSIVFAVACEDGRKGLIISTYGPNVNMDLVEFLDKVKIVRKERLQSDLA